MAQDEDIIDNASLAAGMVDDGVEGFFESGAHAGAMYLRIFDGSLSQTSNTPVDGWEEKKWEKEGVEHVKYLRRFDKVVARVIDIDKEKKEFEATGGKVTNYLIYLMAGGQKAILQLQYMDSVLKRFMKVAPNVDFDRPLLISAWSSIKQGKRKQAVSFRQGPGNNVESWVKVDEYWLTPRDADGVPTGSSKGPDGTVMPQPIQDEDDESWDYKAQNKFLSTYFRENVLPKIKAIAEKVGNVPQAKTGNAGVSDGFSGPPQEAKDPSIKPDDATAGDPMTGKQNAEIKELCAKVGTEAQKASEKIFGVGFDKLSRDAAAYLIYKLIRKLAKQVAEGKVIEAPEPTPPPAASPSASEDEDESDDWGLADVPAPVAEVQMPERPADDDDDIPF